MAAVEGVNVSRRATWAPQRLVEPFLWTLVVAAAAVLAAVGAGILRDVALWRALSVPQWALFVLLAACSYLVLTNLMLFDWRGQRVALGPDEVLVFLALAALPPAAVVLFPILPMALYQVITKRPFLRGAANVAILVLASAAGAAAYVLLLDALPSLLASIGALLVYTSTTHLLVSAVFSLREDAAISVVFGERFWVPTLLHVTLGVAGGVAILALWGLHPAALTALIPFAWLAREHASLVARREREALVHQKLGETTRALVGESSLDRVADRILATCGDIFRAGRATLIVSEDGKEQRWTRERDDGPRTGASPLAASLRDPQGAVIGAVIISPESRQNEPYGEADERLLAIVAGEAAGAVANAGALRELAAARARLETVLATATDAVLLVDTDGMVRYANPAGRILLGLHAEGSAAARDLFEDVAFLRDAVRGEERHLHETWARTPAARLPVEVSSARLKDDPTLVLAVVRDATERKAAEAAVLSQRVSRPLVRRIVRGVMTETGADSLVLMRLGEQLAEGLEGNDLARWTNAYTEMGLGLLTLTTHTADRFEFEGEGLLEQTTGARATTCYLALGFLCGAVGRVRSLPARGAEIECCSRGDARCRFIVTAKAPDAR